MKYPTITVVGENNTYKYVLDNKKTRTETLELFELIGSITSSIRDVYKDKPIHMEFSSEIELEENLMREYDWRRYLFCHECHSIIFDLNIMDRCIIETPAGREEITSSHAHYYCYECQKEQCEHDYL